MAQVAQELMGAHAAVDTLIAANDAQGGTTRLGSSTPSVFFSSLQSAAPKVPWTGEGISLNRAWVTHPSEH
jgi:hypothetical protein